MAKHVLTVKERAKGIRAALRTPTTPPWLRPAMKRYLRQLNRRLKAQAFRKNEKAPAV